jgi:hypothetical protein
MVGFRVGSRPISIVLDMPEHAQHWVVGELRYLRRAAQDEAERAYEAWRNQPRGSTYAAYRAAQDRADAAQDHLAQWLAHAATG